MALIATSSYNRMMQPNYEQQLYEWLWEMMLTLRLHPADLPMPVMQFTQQLPDEDELQGNTLHASRFEVIKQVTFINVIFPSIASGEARPGFASLVKSLSKETLDLANENSLASTTRAIKAGGQLACYAAIAMTTIGIRLVHRFSLLLREFSPCTSCHGITFHTSRLVKSLKEHA